MEVIAKKSGSCVIYMILCFVLAMIGLTAFTLIAVFLPSVLRQDGTPFALLIFPAVFFPMGIFYVTKVKLPKDLILLDSQNQTLTLYNGRIFLLSDVREVTHRRVYSRSKSHEYGTVGFTLKDGEYIEVSLVAEVESVGTRLSKIIYGNNK